MFLRYFNKQITKLITTDFITEIRLLILFVSFYFSLPSMVAAGHVTSQVPLLVFQPTALNHGNIITKQ